MFAPRHLPRAPPALYKELEQRITRILPLSSDRCYTTTLFNVFVWVCGVSPKKERQQNHIPRAFAAWYRGGSSASTHPPSSSQAQHTSHGRYNTRLLAIKAGRRVLFQNGYLRCCAVIIQRVVAVAFEPNRSSLGRVFSMV